MKVLRDLEDDLVTVGGDIAVFETEDGLKQILSDRWKYYATIEELIFENNHTTVIAVINTQANVGKRRVRYTIEEVAFYQ